jgi:hypothetical protein
MIGFIPRSFTIIRNHNQLQYLTVNDCLRLAQFWLDYDWLHSGLSLFWSQLSLSLMLRPTVSQPVCLGIKHPSGAYDLILLLSDRCSFVDVGRSLWREDGCVVYSCCWSSAQPFSGPSPVGLTTIFYCLRFETCHFVASYDSKGYGGDIQPRLHIGLISNDPTGSCYTSITSGRTCDWLALDSLQLDFT